MVFYVLSGRGTVSWVDGEGETYDLEVESGDVYRIGSGTVVYMRSHADPMREKLRVHAIFSTIASEEAFYEAYSYVSDLVRCFDADVLRIGFKVPAEVISELKEAENITPPIVPLPTKNETEETGLNSWKEGIFEALTGGGGGRPLGPVDDNGKKVQKKKKKEKKEKKKKKTKPTAFNIVKAEPDVENCNGRSIAVTDEELDALSETDIGVFMVNLTKGAMMGPHWNPLAAEIAVVTHGRGMVQLVLPSTGGGAAAACRSLRFRVVVGDVFLVPRYHPMAQMSFNDGYLTFVGFSTRVSKNHPQFLAGKRSLLQTLNRGILALSLGVPNATVEQLLGGQEEAIMLECASCAEVQEKKMEAEIQREKEEEARKREEEEKARTREEEEARKREEEEARKREEEEEARKREEEEAARREEEEAREKAEEEKKRRQQEEEEEKRRQQEEEEEERQRQEEQEAEEKRRRKEEEEEEAQKQERERGGREEEEGGGSGGGDRESFKPWRLPIV